MVWPLGRLSQNNDCTTINMKSNSEPKPHCYIAVFGDPYAPGHVHVDGGAYGHKNLPSDLMPGDMLLLYCTGTYKQYPRSVPGFGIVSEVAQEFKKFSYDYFPFKEPLPLEFLRFQITGVDLDKLSNIRFDSYWFFRISNESFSSVMKGALLSSKKDTSFHEKLLLE